MIWPQYFVINIVSTITCLGTGGGGEIWIAREEKQSTQEPTYQWSEHKTNHCLIWVHLGAHFSQILPRVVHPIPKGAPSPLALIDLLNSQGFAALLCYYLRRQQEDAKCCSGPIASLKHFTSFRTWDHTEILGDFMNRDFIKLGEKREESGAQLTAQPWPCWLYGVGRRGATEKAGALFHCQRDIWPGGKELVNGDVEQL